MDTGFPFLRVSNISKAFPGVQALDQVTLHVQRGDVLGLIGENGAGKSTLMKILSGVYQPDNGEIWVDNQPIRIQTPHHAQELGIAIIYQEFNLMPNLSVMENIFIGREFGTYGFVNRRQLRRRTQELLERLGIQLSPATLVQDLSVAEQQMVEIAKSLSMDVRVLIMDEPTSALSDVEVQSLFRVMDELRRDGIGIIFISHRLEEVRTICDRITVLRDGKNAGDADIDDVDEDQIIQMMVGRSLERYYHRQETHDSVSRSDGQPESDIVLEVQGLTRTVSRSESSAIPLEQITFQLHRGEILGLAGLMGAGRTEVARAIFGADLCDSGTILLNNKPIAIRSPLDAIRHGIGFVPEDRKAQGLVLSLAVRENVTLANLDNLTQLGFVQRRAEHHQVQMYVEKLQIRTPTIEQQVVNLSGGNQQKVVISKWLLLQPKILIMDEPTRGIDVGAKAEIYRLIDELAQSGVSIIMISSELPELLAMSDRIICMARGRTTATLTRAEATLEQVMRHCTLVDA